METYTLLRQFADSWALLVLFLTFVGVFAWVWRPSARKAHDEAANAIFRNESKPAGDASRVKEA
ncbi:MAG: cbb3-type cytochrome c oxidase subunit 3 [Cypionkella sp.]|jgi:cytochrome c oxidase cbb3-type subunit 4|nr:cbb3-type cytochrome c oxidase subunit 3 [Cypionkella sp.]